MEKFNSARWIKAFKASRIVEKDESIKLDDLLHTDKVDGKKADKVDIKLGAENDLAIEKDKKGRDVYAQGLTESPISRSKVDYSTLDLKSNINLKWRSYEDMMSDLQQWLMVSFDGVPEAEVTQVAKDLRDLGIEIMKRSRQN